MDKLKHLSSKVAKGAFLAVGIPYGIVIITNMVCGWPCSQEGEGKYKRALQPDRVLKVTYALAEQISLVRLLPVYIKWTSLYSTASNVVKDIQYGINANTLDVWTPQSINQQGMSKSSSSIHSVSQSVSHDSHPIVVFVYGGAWGSGNKNMYGLLAQEIIDHLGAVVVIPNYSIYPKGEVKAMLQDLHDTIAFIKSPDFSQLAPDADQKKIILFGHSAGAHLCALSVIDLAERLKEGQQGAANNDPQTSSGIGGSLDEEINTASVRDDISLLLQDDRDPHLKDGNEHYEEKANEVAVTLQGAGVYRGSSFAADELLSSIRGVVGLGGVYHITDHYWYEAWRGVEDLSPMWRAMNGLGQFDHFSPTERVLKMSPERIRRLPPFYLIHGLNDAVVPASSTEKFAASLTEKGAEVGVRMVAEGGHAELIMDMMDDGRKFHDALINLLLEFGDRVLR